MDVDLGLKKNISFKHFIFKYKIRVLDDENKYNKLF
jgi:hypothetical protein